MNRYDKINSLIEAETTLHHFAQQFSFLFDRSIKLHELMFKTKKMKYINLLV